MLTLIKSGLTPSKKTPKISWKQKKAKKFVDDANDGAINNGPTLRPTSYAAALTRDDSKSLTCSTSPSSSMSPDSERGMIKLTRWASASCDTDMLSARHQYNSPMPSFATLAKLPYSPSPAGPLIRDRRAQHYRQQLHYARSDDDTYSQGFDLNDSILSDDSFNQYDFCVGKSYEFALDNDLAIERKRYYETEKEFVKNFNRKKFNRRFFDSEKAALALGKKKKNRNDGSITSGN